MIQTKIFDPAHNGDIEAVRTWLEEDPERINEYIDEGYTLLHIACLYGQEKLAGYLLACEALVNVDANNESRATPLHLAVMYRDEVIAQRLVLDLVSHGAELNAKQVGGETPLHHAVSRASSILVDALIAEGADPFLKDDQGRSPADLAKLLDNAPDFAKRLSLPR